MGLMTVLLGIRFLLQDFKFNYLKIIETFVIPLHTLVSMQNRTCILYATIVLCGVPNEKNFGL